MEYICYYSCPKCKHPCSDMVEGNEIIDAVSKKDARDFFNAYKTCRHAQITRIEVYNPRFEIVSIEKS